MRLPFLALLILLILKSVLISAQQNNYRMYSIEDSLPQADVRTIVEDSRGYLWIGTNSGGAARFDGLHFTLFDKKKGLIGNTVYSIIEDKEGRLWYGTDEGITISDGFNIRNLNTKNGLSSNTIYKLAIDSKGNVWAGTWGGGVNIITIKPNNSLNITTLKKDNGLSGNYVFDCVEDRFGRMWLATYDGGISIITTYPNHNISIKIVPENILPSTNLLSLGKNYEGNIWAGSASTGAFLITYSDTTNFTVTKKLDLSSGQTENRIWKIYSDEKKRIWFATDKAGVIRLNEDGNYTCFSDKQGYPNNQVLTLYEDSDNNFWFGTMGSGLCKYYGDYFAHYTAKELSTEKILAVAQSKNGTYWIGTGGKGLIKLNFDKNNNPIIKILNEKDGLFDPYVNSIAIDKNGVLWLATTSGIFSYNQQIFTNYSTADNLVGNSVNCVYVDSKNRLWCGTMSGLSIFNGRSFFNIDEDHYGLINNDVQTITEDKHGTVWIGTLGGIACFKNNQMTDFDEKEGLMSKKTRSIVCDPSGNVWIASFGVGLYLYDAKKTGTKKITLKADENLLTTGNIYSVIFSNDTTLIIGTNKGFKMIVMDRSYKFRQIYTFDISNGFKGIENNLNAILKDNQGNIWFGTAKGVTRFSPSLYHTKNVAPKTHIVDLMLFYKSIDWLSKAGSVARWSKTPNDLVLSYTDNHLTFRFEGISLANPEKVNYQYMLEGIDKEWSPSKQNNEAQYPGLEPNEYTFKVRAANEYGTWNSKPQIFHFVINPPFYRTWWFYTLCIVFIVSVIIIYIKWREAKLKRDKAVLEQTVKERTAEVVKQKEILEEQKQEITDSIHYASRIQRAILPAETLTHSILKDYFILYKPRDIVSGDFYWTTIKDDRIVLTVADCTGHGVPGAFMSMLGVSFLNEIVNEKGIVSPDEILNTLRGNIINALQQKETIGGSKDGMDIALVSIDEKRNIIQYAGANNSIFLVRENELTEVKADKMPIAIYLKMDGFLNHEIPYQKGDIVYLFSDGYVDQFGGPKGKKFMSKHFKEYLLSIHEFPMITQQHKLDQRIEEWKLESNQSQNDDICVIGLRL
jgi:ligand-binding sensor domain-containing protein/serine phosphatase RsbU (regulator of sigma subunit)